MAPHNELTSLADILPSPSPSNAAYLASLPNLALSELLSTPTALTTQSHTVTSSLTALTHTSYATFLSLHETSTALLGSLSSLDTALDALLTSALPALDDAARVFRERSGPSVVEDRQKARVVLEQHDKLRDLLDVPVLIDTCVRNALYAEALALAAHANAALKTLPADGAEMPLQLAASLQAEVASSLHAMRLLLLDTLHDPARKLPAFWKAVQFLRRMHAMPEDELALAFVSARINCLRNALQGLERDAGIAPHAPTSSANIEDRERDMDRDGEDAARFLKKYVDAWREGAYDLITQYTTIFLERSLGASAPQDLPPPPSHTIKQTLPPTLLALLLPTLETHLHRAYPHLAPLATQLAYCSSALARVGMDFRALLSPLLCRAVTRGFTHDIQHGASQLFSSYFIKPPVTTTTTTTITTTTTKSKPAPPSTWLLAPSHAHSLPTLPALDALSSSAASTSTSPHTPPPLLSAFPPLAATLNAYLRALNRLRLLGGEGEAMPGVLRAAEGALAAGAGEMLAWAGEETEQKELERERRELEIVRAAGAAYVRVLVPFVRRAVVEGVFGVPMGGWERGAVVGGASGAGNGHAIGDGGVGSEAGGALDAVVREWEGWIGGEGAV
ncbi:hypothetical protein BV22DRAFT_1066744 [Leucogyrophana mollusca]|uniref:Uncharacterized protein n=1 Tax=Leucogyrophana mollusca TaxID=85980 RepID=A0ACB8BGW5_9AGAM|nr:hypothetical protein BV22DRAFT_1066744 [Leucogyrophana mollusca]